jgi:hypothetical protein
MPYKKELSSLLDPNVMNQPIEYLFDLLGSCPYNYSK